MSLRKGTGCRAGARVMGSSLYGLPRRGCRARRRRFFSRSGPRGNKSRALPSGPRLPAGRGTRLGARGADTGRVSRIRPSPLPGAGLPLPSFPAPLAAGVPGPRRPQMNGRRVRPPRQDGDARLCQPGPRRPLPGLKTKAGSSGRCRGKRAGLLGSPDATVLGGDVLPRALRGWPSLSASPQPRVPLGNCSLAFDLLMHLNIFLFRVFLNYTVSIPK